jgi:hypothetical protein
MCSAGMRVLKYNFGGKSAFNCKPKNRIKNQQLNGDFQKAFC